MTVLDPETDARLWALAFRISDLETPEQAGAVVPAITVLLAEQTPATVDRVFAQVKKMLVDFQETDAFRAAKAQAARRAPS